MSPGLDICLVLSPGSCDPTRIADAVLRHEPDARLHAVWVGDPHHRPALGRLASDRVRWADLGLDEPTGAGWGRLLAALPTDAFAWVRAARSGSRLLRSGADRVVVARVGSVAVVGPLGQWVAPVGVTAIERSPDRQPVDGLAPSDPDVAVRGKWSTAVLGVAGDSVDIMDEIAAAMSQVAPNGSAGPVLDLVLSRLPKQPTAPHSGVAVGWTAGVEPFVVLDVVEVAPDEPWRLDFGTTPPRRRFSGDLALADAVASSVDQWRGDAEAPTLPGGIEVDQPIRILMHEALSAWRRGDGELPPDPYGADFVDWLEAGSPRSGGTIGRYWFEEWARRPDLHAIFPDPIGADRDRFLTWAHRSWSSDRRSPLIRARHDAHDDVWTDAGHRPGVNVIGYLASDSGLGDFSRRLYRSVCEAGTAVGALHYHRTASPTAADHPALTTDVAHDTNLIAVHGEQMRFFADDHGPQVFPGRKSIGYWFWEASALTPGLVDSIGLVDEIWVATEFVASAYRDATDRPVRVVPVPVPEPDRAPSTRAELGLPDDRFVFVVTLDHLSITDRKNPIAAIRAFEHAFPDPSPSGPVLFVKTLNARQRWAEHEELQLAAARRDDITVVDRHLSRSSQMRLIELSDCLVSLHRSEGLGLHLQEAMWLDTALIATRYSGNLDFMNDENSMLIDAELIPVADRQGYYPRSAVWADPSIEQAAEAMRRMIDDAPHRETLAAAAKRDMIGQPSLSDTGYLIAALCRDAKARGVK